MKRILFIVNPFSGVGKQHGIRNVVKEELDTTQFKPTILRTKHKGHATELAREAIGHYDIVAAVGGDGTINEVGTGLLGSNTPLAIIPSGSGNGLARFLGIPQNLKDAIKIINHGHSRLIDTLDVNGHCSLNVAGVGFDGYISHKFAQTRWRGPLGYIRTVTKEFPLYQPSTYYLNIDGETYMLKALVVSFANASQYGNNIYIAPNALVDDGLMNVSIVKDFPKIMASTVLVRLMNKTIEDSEYAATLTAKRIEIYSEDTMWGHIDGEPIEFEHKIVVEMKPLSLNVIVPEVIPATPWENFMQRIPNIDFLKNW